MFVMTNKAIEEIILLFQYLEDLCAFYKKTGLFTARCTIVHSAVLPSHVVRLSVCNVGGL